MQHYFLHGLDSSSDGTKGKFFKSNFPDVIVPDFAGSLEIRLQKLENLCNVQDGDDEPVVLVGSSFGGLMAACFAVRHPKRTARLILMAPALNFPGLEIPAAQITAPTYLLIGSRDPVTPAKRVIPIAKQMFAHLEINLVDEDHLLHQSFPTLDWQKLLNDW
jgi:pimeloyl-ACP methyl ester carboxylesterase